MMTDETIQTDSAVRQAGTPASGGEIMPPDLGRGLAYLKAEVKTLTGDPGVYRMLDENGEGQRHGRLLPQIFGQCVQRSTVLY